jgi:hypothetical protein
MIFFNESRPLKPQSGTHEHKYGRYENDSLFQIVHLSIQRISEEMRHITEITSSLRLTD